MSKADLFDFDASTPANNSDINGTNIAEGCAPGNVNDALRAFPAIVKRALGSKGSDIASASTTAIAAAGTSLYAKVTGTTTISALGTVAAGTLRIIEFTGALTLTHNATSLILPGQVNIATAAGDTAIFISLGSGNWKCVGYFPISGSVVGGFSSVTATSTDAGATGGPNIIADRNSASPAANDEIGSLFLRGRDSGGNATDYARISGTILDPTNASEDGQGRLLAMVAGTETSIVKWGPGVQIGSPTGGDQGAGTLNVDTAIYVDGVISKPTVVRYYDEYSSNAQITATIPLDDTAPASTEGTSILSRAATTTSATQRVRIHVNGFGEQSTTGAAMIMALFRGTTCVQVSVFDPGAGLYVEPRPISLLYDEQPGAAGSYTYSVRVGASSGNMRMNGTEGGRLFGGTAKTVMAIEVYEP